MIGDVLGRVPEIVRAARATVRTPQTQDGPPVQPIRRDREQPGGEMPRPSGTSSPVSMGTVDEIHPNQVIQA